MPAGALASFTVVIDALCSLCVLALRAFRFQLRRASCIQQNVSMITSIGSRLGDVLRSLLFMSAA